MTKNDYDQIISGFEAFLEWWEASKMTVLEQEMHLVSEELRFGGTPDATLIDSKGRTCLGDWKTGSGPWADHLLQLAAYWILWDEHHPDNPITGGAHLCVFRKEKGDFAHHYYPALDVEKEAFRLMRPLYDKMLAIKKRA
jgi:hypothetical protein